MTKQEAYERISKLWQDMVKHTYVSDTGDSFCLLAPLTIVKFDIGKVYCLVSTEDDKPIATARWEDETK